MSKNHTFYSSILSMALFLSVTLPTSTTVKADESSDSTQEVLVVYKNLTGKNEILSESPEVEEQYKNLPAVSVTLTDTEINKLEESPNIAYIEPDQKVKLLDSEYQQTGTLLSSSVAEESQWGVAASKASTAWAEGLTGEGVKIAILDTGISSHPDLHIAGGISMIDYTTSYADDEGHGTHVAGIVGALRNGAGMVGIAPSAQLYSVKVLDSAGEGDLSDVLAGIDWAITNKMNIINMSLGSSEDSELLHAMIDKAYSNGLLIVSASGNSGNDTGTGDSINYPAKYANAVSVSAVDENLNRAPFSSTGSKIDVAAPGVNIVSTYYLGGYATASGTSQASPHVTGILALLKQKYPTKNNNELISLLKTYAKDLGTQGKDTWFGEGLAQYQMATPTIINLPQRGYIDTPVYGSSVSGLTNVSGWFLDGNGVSKIEVLIDGKVIGSAQYGTSRNDVAAVFPQYGNALSGYHYMLDTSLLANGDHQLSIRETGNTGITTTLSNVIIKVYNLPKKGYLDTPFPGAVLQGSSPISGWLLDTKGVSKIEILLDDTLLGLATYGGSRTDVQKAFPQYQNGNAGFSYNLDTTKFLDGKHTLTVREISNDGTVYNLSQLSIVISNLPPARGYLDSPQLGATISGKTDISGWFLDGSKVTKIDILVDGKINGTAQYGLARPDVGVIFPQYQNTNSGFKYILDTRILTNGEHILTIRETNQNGATNDINSKFNVSNLPAKGYLDGPSSTSTLSSIVNVNGWFLDGSEVSQIDVLVDGKKVGVAQYGLARLDVGAAFNAYKNDYSGFNFSLDTTLLSNGDHQLTIRETSKNGTISTLPSQTIKVSNLLPIGYIDSPLTSETVSDMIQVRGWFLDSRGVVRVEIWVDGKYYGTAEYGQPRNDVLQAFPSYHNANSGFSYTLDTTTFTVGIHTLTIKETGANGSITSISSPFKVSQ